MTEFAKATGNCINNSAAMKKLASADKGCAVLGGQKALSVLDEIAAAARVPKEYTPACARMADSFMLDVRTAVLNDLSLTDYCYPNFCETHCF